MKSLRSRLLALIAFGTIGSVLVVWLTGSAYQGVEGAGKLPDISLYVIPRPGANGVQGMVVPGADYLLRAPDGWQIVLYGPLPWITRNEEPLITEQFNYRPARLPCDCIAWWPYVVRAEGEGAEQAANVYREAMSAINGQAADTPTQTPVRVGDFNGWRMQSQTGPVVDTALILAAKPTHIVGFFYLAEHEAALAPALAAINSLRRLTPGESQFYHDLQAGGWPRNWVIWPLMFGLAVYGLLLTPQSRGFGVIGFMVALGYGVGLILFIRPVNDPAPDVVWLFLIFLIVGGMMVLTFWVSVRVTAWNAWLTAGLWLLAVVGLMIPIGDSPLRSAWVLLLAGAVLVAAYHFMQALPSHNRWLWWGWLFMVVAAIPSGVLVLSRSLFTVTSEPLRILAEWGLIALAATFAACVGLSIGSRQPSDPMPD